MSTIGLSRYKPTQSIPPRIEDLLENFSDSASKAIVAIQTHLRFEFVKRVGREGTQGGALLFNERKDDGTFLRQVIAKYYIVEDEDWDEEDAEFANADANREYNVLKRLRGAEHIVQLLGRGRVRLGERIDLLVEFAGHGDLGTVLDRFSQSHQPIPNRVLWSLFLCLIRACIAMDYPPSAPRGAPTQRETIPAQRTSSCRIFHRDIHFGNVLVAGVDVGDSEHSLCPMIKLIDFGSADLVEEDLDISELSIEEDDDHSDDVVMDDVDGDSDDDDDDIMDEGDNTGVFIEETSSQVNLFDIGVPQLMSNLSLGREALPPPRDASRDTVVETPTGPVQIATLAPLELTQGRGSGDAPITRALRSLICRCMAADAADRPSLPEALAICENAIERHSRRTGTDNDDDDAKDLTAELGDNVVYETDQAVRRLVGEFFLNAEVDEEAERLRIGRRGTVPVSRRQGWRSILRHGRQVGRRSGRRMRRRRRVTGHT